MLREARRPQDQQKRAGAESRRAGVSRHAPAHLAAEDAAAALTAGLGTAAVAAAAGASPASPSAAMARPGNAGRREAGARQWAGEGGRPGGWSCSLEEEEEEVGPCLGIGIPLRQRAAGGKEPFCAPAAAEARFAAAVVHTLTRERKRWRLLPSRQLRGWGFYEKWGQFL